MFVASPHTSHTQYRPDIDGLRAFAVLSVVAFHAFPRLLRGGFVGVDVFFVISGYLISLILIGGLKKGSFSFFEFYARRARRIFPALVLVLSVSLIVGWFALHAHEFRELGKHVLGGAGFVSNLVYWTEAGYFDKSAEEKPLLHLWSLGIEEQFYLVWPLILWAAWKCRLGVRTPLLVCAILSLGLNLYQVRLDVTAGFYSPLTRFWELLCGAALAWLHSWDRQTRYLGAARSRFVPDSNWLAGAGLLLLVFSVVLINRRLSFPGVWALPPVLGATLVIAAGPGAWINRVLFSNRLAVWIGLISFPLYLWHWPILVFQRILVHGEPSVWARLGAVLTSVGLAWATYRFIERPVRTRKPGQRGTALIVLLVAVCGVLGFLVYQHDGYPERHPTSPNDYVVRGWHLNGKDIIDCSERVRATSSSLCATVKDPAVALVGDSHAGALFYGLVRNPVDAEFRRVVVYTSGSCQPSLDVEAREGCNLQLEIALREIIGNVRIRTVILTGYFGFTDDLTAEMRGRYLVGYQRTIDRLRAAGRRIVFVIDNPALGESADLCAPLHLPVRRYFYTPPSFCTVPADIVLKDQSTYRGFVNELRTANADVAFYDPAGILCPAGQCHLFDGGQLLYGDDNHLSIYGSERVANDMVAFLTRSANRQPEVSAATTDR